MSPGRGTAAALGALFVTIMVTWSLGFWLIGEVLASPTYLADAFPRQNRIALGVLFELIDVGAVLAMIAVVYPLMKGYSETLAGWYLGFRVIECVMLVAALVCAVAVITLSKAFLNSGGADTSALQAMGALCVAVRGRWVQLVLPFFYGSAKIAFFYFLLKTRLVPRALSVVGLVGASLVMVGIPMDFLELRQGAFLGALMGLTELFLGCWLLIRGFNGSAHLEHLEPTRT